MEGSGSGLSPGGDLVALGISATLDLDEDECRLYEYIFGIVRGWLVEVSGCMKRPRSRIGGGGYGRKCLG